MRPNRYPGRVYDPILSRCVGATPQARRKCKLGVSFYAMGAYGGRKLSDKQRKILKAAVKRIRNG